MALKLKTRTIVLCVIFVMFFVSFKILEPELEEHPGGRDVRDFSDYETRDSEVSQDIDPLDPAQEASVRVAYFTRKYAMDWGRPNTSTHDNSLWAAAGKWVNHRTLYPDHPAELGAILHQLSTAKITRAGLGYRGTQLKMSLILDGGQKAAFKPQWYNRDHVIAGKPYDGADRHNGEIAAFHLNRLLGFNRSPIVVGRVVSMQHEIRPVADQSLLDTFYQRDNDTCFYGKCYYCKGPETGVCGSGDHMEGALVLWLPLKWQFQTIRSPWQRTYRDDIEAQWERDPNFCEEVRELPTYRSGPRLLDLIDACVMDYLIGNADAHHYDVFKGHNESVVVLMDRAKSFGNPFLDEITILAPLYQCCSIRKSTWKRLKLLGDGVLSEVLRQMMAQDSITPVLTEPHLLALDRRLKKLQDQVDQCVRKKGLESVLVTDKFTDS